MRLFGWLGGFFSKRGQALSHYRRGMERAKVHDHPGAIAEYTRAVELSAGSPDVQSMALYNRAISYLADHQEQPGADDLHDLLELPGAQSTVKMRARQKLIRMGLAQEKKDEKVRQAKAADDRRESQHK